MNWESQSPLSREVEKDQFRLPDGVPISTTFVNESGAKNSSDGFFVVRSLKARESVTLGREIRHLRQWHKFFEGTKFSGIRREPLRFFCDVAELVTDSDVHVGGSVYDSYRSFISRCATWEVQANMSTKLVVASANKGRSINVFLDLAQTPHGETVAARVRDQVNQKLGQCAVLGCCDLDLKLNNLPQIVGAIAGPAAYARRPWAGDAPDAPGTEQTPKAEMTGRLRKTLGLDTYDDVRANKANIPTMNHG